MSSQMNMVKLTPLGWTPMMAIWNVYLLTAELVPALHPSSPRPDKPPTDPANAAFQDLWNGQK